MSPAAAQQTIEPTQTIEHALINNDFSTLTVEQRWDYYKRVCEKLGLNPLTKPFEYTKLNGKLTLYAKKDCTEQLRKIHGVSITALESQITTDIVIVTAHATDANGRADIATGAASIEGKKGEDRANAIMKAETKAKRRVTLSLCGLGMLDETEVEADTYVTQIQADSTPLVEQPEMSSAPAVEGGTFHAAPNFAPNSAPNSLETKPSQKELDSYKAWAAEVRRKLEDAGLQPSAGVSTGNKLVRFITKTSGVEHPRDLNIGQWNAVILVLDSLITQDAKKAVERIEETIK